MNVTVFTAENYKFSLMDLACNYVAIHGAAALVIQDLGSFTGVV